MPSLKALEEFKTSFRHIGNEVQVLRAQELPLDDYPLPGTEPVPLPAFDKTPAPEPEQSEGEESSLDSLFGGGFSDLVAGGLTADGEDALVPDAGERGEILPGEDLLDLDAAGYSLGENFPSGGEDENPEAGFPGDGDSFRADDLGLEDTGDSLNMDDLGDFSQDENFLPGDENPEDGFAGDGDSFRADDLGLEDAGDSLNMDDLDGLGLPDEGDESLEAGFPGDEDESFLPGGEDLSADDLDLGEDDNLNLDDLDGLGLPDDGEESAAGDESLEAGFPGDEDESFLPRGEDLSADDLDLGEEDNLNLDDLDGLGLPDGGAESAAGDESLEAGFLGDEDESFLPGGEEFSAGDLDLGEEDNLNLDDLDGLGLPEEGPGGFDMSPEAEETAAQVPDGITEVPTKVVDQSLENFNKFDLGNETPPPSEPETKGGKADENFALAGFDDILPALDKKSAPAVSKAGKRLKEESEEVEEIQLTNDELSRFQATLSSYPLNLRIACEELIAEQAVDPALMSKLVKMLVHGAPAKETAALVSKILGKTISIPKGFEKKTGEALEAERASFGYIFVHNFLPVLRLFFAIALVVTALGYLIYEFVYIPGKAESIYKRGYERISAGEYGRARDRFKEAFSLHPVKGWFYKYAEAFQDERQYIYAEEKYDELLWYTASKNSRGIPEKKAVLDYARMETYQLRNYKKADDLLRRNILDYSIYDREALLAVGDNALAWAEVDPERYEDAREAFALYLERNGQNDTILERMLKYFIRTDNLKEVLPLKNYFMASPKRKISAESLAEMGGYLLDKQTEEVQGVPNAYLESIEGLRDIFLKAIKADPKLPESFYHLARYYNQYNDANAERVTLEQAIENFDSAREETIQRMKYRIDAQLRYAAILIQNKEFFPAEEALIKGVNLYEDGQNRRILSVSPEYGKLYAGLGDLEYFVKDGNMEMALEYYKRSEASGWAPPEILYRMGGAHYQLRQWEPALERFFSAASQMTLNSRILYALGNVSFQRGNYFAAQGYYTKLLEILDREKGRFPSIMPGEGTRQMELAERLMVAQNNLGVTLEALTRRTGDNLYRSRSLGLFSESARAWDTITRNPETMVRMVPAPGLSGPGVNPAYLNVRNSLHPTPDYEMLFFIRINKDMLEPSDWEELAPPDYRLSEGISAR